MGGRIQMSINACKSGVRIREEGGQTIIISSSFNDLRKACGGEPWIEFRIKEELFKFYSRYVTRETVINWLDNIVDQSIPGDSREWSSGDLREHVFSVLFSRLEQAGLMPPDDKTEG